MEGGIPNPEVFTHVRVIIGIVLGLSVSRLLTGIAEIIQHPQRKNIYVVHLGWVLFAFLTVVHFWWFEFNMRWFCGNSRHISLSFSLPACTFLRAACFSPTAWRAILAMKIISCREEPGSSEYWYPYSFAIFSTPP